MAQEALFTGFHSVIEESRHPSGYNYLDKQYGEKSGGISFAQSLMLGGLMHNFQQKAEYLGISVSRPMGLFITNNSHYGMVTLHEVVRNEGLNVKQLLQSGSLSKRLSENILRKVLGMHRQAFDSNWLISLDPPLPNFCLGETGNLCYVDRMPPRQKLENGEIFCDFPIPSSETRSFIEQRYFSDRQSQVIYAQLLRDTHGHLPAAKIKELIGEVLGEKAYEQVNVPHDQRKHILNRSNPMEVDLIRIIAGELSRGKEALEHIFKLTHIGVGGVMPSEITTQLACGLLNEM